MKRKTLTWQCDMCGKFVPYNVKELGGAVEFTPDTEYTAESIDVRCPECVEKYSKPKIQLTKPNWR